MGVRLCYNKITGKSYAGVWFLPKYRGTKEEMQGEKKAKQKNEEEKEQKLTRKKKTKTNKQTNKLKTKPL